MPGTSAPRLARLPMFRFPAATGLLGLLVAIALAPAAEATSLYQLDDGTAETAFGQSAGQDMLWLNGFETQPGAEVVTAIQVQWGVNVTHSGAGRPVSVLLYDDPNNDGNPADAILLTSAATTATPYGTGVFAEVPITPTQVSGTFFVAALHEDAPNGLTFMAAMDATTPQGRSWILHSTSGSSIDPNDLSGANQLPTGSPGTDANFGLRAVAVPVPEPGTAGLLLAGLAALSRLRRPHQQRRS